jgi:catechol 2,3-dioxygenase-like lactoylglutathione lyase family enzyme
MIKRLAHVCLMSTDLAASEHFYCEVLGLKKAFDFTKDDKPFGFYVECGDTTFIEVFIRRDEGEPQRPLINHLCLELEDIDAFIASVRSKGWEITDKKKGVDQSWQAWITDPSGVRIEVMQYTEDSSQFTGRTVVANW